MNKIIQKFLVNNPAISDIISFLIHFKAYKKQYRFLKKSDKWSRDEIEEYQLQELNRLLNHCYENVPYYTKLFNNLGLKPNDIQSIKDMQKLPYLTKKIVRENTKDFIAKNIPKEKLEFITTGGSTGEPLGIYILKGDTEARHQAYKQTILDYTKSNFTNRQLYLAGSEKMYSQQIFGRIVALSSFFMKEDNLPFYIEKIRKLKPTYILAYPSAIFTLARFINKYNISPFPSLKLIICSGEVIYDWQRDIIKKTFQCKIHAFYNQAELVVFAKTCNFNFIYHVYPQFGITELIGTNKKPITKDGERGEIIGTSFFNYAFPLIRYNTKDIGILSTKKCDCGSNYLLLENIEGRAQEFVVSELNRYVPLTGIYGLVARSSINVKDCQFFQEIKGELILNIVKDDNYSNLDEEKIKNNFVKRFEGEIKLKTRYVNNISRTKVGKSRFLIQKLPINNWMNDV